MKIFYERKNKDLPAPEPKTEGATALDLHCLQHVNLYPGQMTVIPLNEKVKVPEGYLGLIHGRSSTFQKHKLISVPGFIDQDYNGKEDWLGLMVYNPGRIQAVQIEKGQRIAQIAFVKIWDSESLEIEEDKLDGESRGGFGTTGA